MSKWTWEPNERKTKKRDFDVCFAFTSQIFHTPFVVTKLFYFICFILILSLSTCYKRKR